MDNLTLGKLRRERENRSNKQNTSNSRTVSHLAQCPMCYRSYHRSAIYWHASNCNGSHISPAPTHIKKTTAKTLQTNELIRRGSSHCVALLPKLKIGGKQGRALLLIREKWKGRSLNWAGGKVDYWEIKKFGRNCYSHALARESNEEYGLALGTLCRQQHPTTENHAYIYRGSHMFVTILPKNFSIKSWQPTQRRKETTGATYVWVNDVLKAKRNWLHHGKLYVKIFDVYGRYFSMTGFVLGATTFLERRGKLYT